MAKQWLLPIGLKMAGLFESPAPQKENRYSIMKEKTYKLVVISTKDNVIIEEQVFSDIDVLQTAIKYLDISIDNDAALEYEIYMLDNTGKWIVI